jgi:hypothetical protein
MTPQDITNSDWYAGPPPHIGWWNASVDRSQTSWRWWDGVRWGIANSPRAKRPFTHHTLCTLSLIMWTWAWPDNARCARVNPATGGVTGPGPIL